MDRGFVTVVLRVAAVALVGGGSAVAGAPRWPEKALEAQTRYESGEFGEAAAAYADAIAGGDHRPELSFNLGNARYRAAGDDTTGLAAAFDAYQRAIAAAEPALRPEAMYNAANTLFRLGRLSEAEKLFREVLRQDPTHDRARYNLELVQRLLENSPEPQGSQQNPDSSSDQQDEEKSPPDGNPSERPAPEDQPKDQQDEQQDQEPREPEGEQPPDKPGSPEREGDETTPPSQPEPADSVAAARGADRPPPSISSEEALRELAKLEEAEKEHLRQLLQARRRRANVEKDW
jgi:Ca-activated chloride channel family protein